jgi:hypothetical protein
VAVFAAATAACGDSSGPGDDEPRLIQARYSPADPPATGENYAAQVSTEPGGIQADVLVRADPACNSVNAGIEVTDTLLLIVQTIAGAGCVPLSGWTLVEAVIIGVPDDPPPFRIEWWHGEVVDTVWEE